LPALNIRIVTRKTLNDQQKTNKIAYQTTQEQDTDTPVFLP